jgi:hypothetical protein
MAAHVPPGSPLVRLRRQRRDRHHALALLPEGRAWLMIEHGADTLAEHELSVALAERVLLPAVRRDPPVTVVADGFSCREQLRQLASVRGRHLAELLATVPTLA